jgi:cell division protease FtsH
VIRPWPTAILGPRPELADVPRLAGRLLSVAVTAARGHDAPARRALAIHLGPEAARWPVVTASWAAFDQVNVQAALDAWLGDPGVRHELLGLTGVRHGHLDLADLTADDLPRSPAGVPGTGSVTTVARPAGPGGATRACVTCGLYLIEQGGQRSAVLLRGPAGDDPRQTVSLQVTAADQAAAGKILDHIRALATTHNVYRGQVISFGADISGPAAGVLEFLDRPQLGRATVILPPDVLDGIERQVLGIARHSGRLSASGQHLRRGVLLHGPPGTGKTHTVRYLIGQLPHVTAIVIPGAALRFIGEACAIARTLQPSVVVVEDVELAAESRGPHAPLPPPLVRLLTEMEGVGDDADVTFLLTTDRADLLEEALAARPGLIDHAARLPLPDAAARRRLLRLYQGSLRISRPSAGAVVARTDGVNASFIRELLRRAAVYAADGRGTRAAALSEVNALAPATANGSGLLQATGPARDPHNGAVQVPANGSSPAEVNEAAPVEVNEAAPVEVSEAAPAGVNGAARAEVNGSAPASGITAANGAAPGQAVPLRVSARHLNLALDELLDSRHDLTRVLLGSRPMRGADAIIRPVLPRLRPTR